MLTSENGRSVGKAAFRLPTDGDRGSGLLTYDPLALIAVAALVALGVLNLLALADPSLAIHQLISVLVGIGLLFLLRRTRIGSLRLLGIASYGIAVALLLGVAALGVEANGARRWLLLGSLAVQPSELAKLGLLLVLAGILAGAFSWKRLTVALGAATLPTGLTVLQPDLSTSLILVALTLAALLLARLPLRALLLPVLGIAAVAPLGEHLLRPYQLARLHAFLGGSHDVTGSGWSVLQAHIAIASGGFFGLHNNSLHLLLAEYLPARQTDLAFASLVEERGLLAGLLALAAVAILVWRLVASSRAARTRQAALVPGLLAFLFGSEAVISLAGNLGVLPLAGVPFPFLSYGGTSATAHLAALGLVLSARRDAQRRPLWMAPRTRRPRLQPLRLTALAIVAVLASLGSLTWQIQASGSPLRQDAKAQMTRCVGLPAPRGMITDRHGVPLALNSTSDQVMGAPGLLVHRAQPLDQLAPLLGTTAEGLESQLEGALGQLTVGLGEVPPAVASRIENANFAGVLLEPSPHRLYPFGFLVAPLLGFVGIATPEDVKRFPDLPPGAYVGRAGLEWQYDALLRGEDGQQCFYVDPTGEAVALAQHTNPVPGANLQLSLDLGLQREVTAQLAQALGGVAGQRAGSEGAAVVLDPRNGQVLAMASLPSFDNNIYGPPVDSAALLRAEAKAGGPMLEHATQEAAPPGSTFKLVVGAADAVYQTVPPDEVIPTGYTFTLDGHTFHGWGYLPPQDLTQAIAWSNDVYFYKLAMALGPGRIHSIGTQLGLGQPTGIDLPGELAGYLGTPADVARQGETWYPGSTALLGIGQGYIDVSPLQVARWTAAVSSGKLLTPRLGLAFQSGAEVTPISSPTPVALPFASRLAPVQQGLRLAVTQGTGTLLSDLPIAVGGKTGTAEDPSNPNGQPDAWFTAAAPIGNPEVVLTVLVQGGGEGNLTSEPAAKAILGYYLQHQGSITDAAGA